MKTYFYPENLKAAPRLWFWNVRDFSIICICVILSALLFAKLHTPLPMAATICFGFLTLRTEDTAVIDYIWNALHFFCLSQQDFRWYRKELAYETKEKQCADVDRI